MIIVLNKPYGVLSQFTPETGSKWRTLADFDLPPHVYPIGRLDADSEGMLVLSDDARLVSRLLDPVHGHPRTYLVQVEHEPSVESMQQLIRGITIQGYTTRPCRARLMSDVYMPERIPPIRSRKAIPTAWLEIELTEGKNRQVRRMTAAVGHPTLRLIRVKIGALSLDSLDISVGEWCVIDDARRLQLLQRSQ